MFPGYASFGWVADYLGRRKSFLIYTFMASLLVGTYATVRQPWLLLVVGTVVAFFGTRIFFWLWHHRQRDFFPPRFEPALWVFTYNGARAMSSIAPFVIGRVGETKGLSWAFYLCAVSLLAGHGGGNAVYRRLRENNWTSWRTGFSNSMPTRLVLRWQ